MATVISRLYVTCRLASKLHRCPTYKNYQPTRIPPFNIVGIFKMSTSPVVGTKLEVAEPNPADEPKQKEIIAENIALVKEEIQTFKSNENKGVEEVDAKNDDLEATNVETKVPYVRIKKRKVILLMSYCGQGYYGMQKNPDTKTIEDELLKALLKASYIDEESYKKPQNLNFQRAARTDKSVSAARQVVSLKLPEQVELNKINEQLPNEIRVMSLKRVTKGFDAKASCDGRTYMYMMPTFAFVPIDGKVTEDYRITPEVLAEVRKTLKVYLGTKNFHNFTSRRKATDPSANRYIIDFTCSDPFIKDGLEYVILRVKGQSFMLHQIRKMIGLVTAILRGFANMSTVEKTWAKERIDIPRAPGVGLVLDQVHYDRYNERFGSDGIHEKLAWDEQNDEIEKFCHDFVYPIITKTENEEKSMLNWLDTLIYHTYDVREDGAPKLTQLGQAAMLASKDKVAAGSSSDEEDDDEDSPVKSKRRKIYFKH